jgi:hypothetical protein
MAGSARTSWQQFKKKYPDFEKSKNFKSDLGPNLDKWEAAAAKARKARDDYTAALDALLKAVKTVSQIAGGYGRVIDELKGSHRGIDKEFTDIFEFEVKMNNLPIVDLGESEAKACKQELMRIKF